MGSKNATSAPGGLSPAPEESPAAFAACQVYLELPGKRRLTTVAAQTGAGLRSIYRWAHDFDWAGRLRRHLASLQDHRDQLQAAAARDDLIAWSERATAIREREWEIADDLLEALQRRLLSGELDANALVTLARTFALTSKIGRLATGLTPDSTVDDPAVPDPREDEFEAAL